MWCERVDHQSLRATGHAGRNDLPPRAREQFKAVAKQFRRRQPLRALRASCKIPPAVHPRSREPPTITLNPAAALSATLMSPSVRAITVALRSSLAA